jgi:hypothetical protein
MTRRKSSGETLETLAEMALSNARRQMEATRRLNPRVALEIDGRIKWLPDAPIMDSDPMKDRFFDYLRRLVEQKRATAMIFVTDTWFGEPTEKHKALARDNPEELKRIALDADIAKFEKLGLATRVEAITVLVQTPEEVLTLNQQYERTATGGIVWNKRQKMKFPQSKWDGRTKMYGVKET